MRNRLKAQLEHRAVLVSRRFQRCLSFQFGLTSAAMAPHWVHAIRDNAETIGLTQKSIPVDNVMAQSRQDQSDAACPRSAAKTALLSGAPQGLAILNKPGASMPRDYDPNRLGGLS